MGIVLAVIAVILVVWGILSLFSGSILWGIILIVAGCAIGPGGWTVYGRR